MHIERYTPDDHETVAAAVELSNAAMKVDAPFNHPYTVTSYELMLRYGWDLEVPETFAAWDGGALVGLAAVHTSEWDNTHLAWLEVLVHPDRRGEGRGSEILRFATERARELGRTSIGLDGWDVPETLRFAARHDLPRKSSAIKRRQTVSRLDRADLEQVYAESAAAATDYELFRMTGRTPEDLLPDLARMAAAINDAPTDDLDIEDEVYSADRMRDYESAMLGRGKRLYRVLARHRETGALAGHTVVVVDSDRPWIADQHDTSVVAAHRGHRLGLVLKADMLRWLGEAEPQVQTLDTWNAESNDHMIRVNERLGYEVLARELQFQRDIG